MMKNPLLDQEFLEKLFLYNHKEVYAKITLLSFDELPVKEIQGMITAGSVNVDGNSAVRRTCSLTMITQEGYISDAHWGLRNKIKLEVGLKNFIDNNYPDTIWFKQGMFIITSLNENFATNSHQITIQGKDKMCLLNGEVGGNLIASTDFGKLEEYIKDEDGNEHLQYIYLKIKDIIKYAVGTFGMELPHNIIIEDIDDYGKELLEYRGDRPLYLFNDLNNSEITQILFESNNIVNNNVDNYVEKIVECYKSGENLEDSPIIMDLVVKRDFKVDERDIDYQAKKNEAQDQNYRDVYEFLRDHKIAKMNSNDYDDNGNFIFDTSISELSIEKQAPTVFYINDEGQYVHLDLKNNNNNNNNMTQYTAIKLQYGDTAGYRQTDLTYPGDLKANIGESLTSILDKIKQMFGDYEYFYDLDGRFIFQKKKTYINNSWNSLITDTVTDTTYANAAAYSSAVTWRFENNMLLTAFSNNPNIQNLKNDFAVWGERQSVSGVKLPVHIRYAIQEKPVYYCSCHTKKEYKAGKIKNNEVVSDTTNLVYSFYDGNDWLQDIIEADRSIVYLDVLLDKVTHFTQTQTDNNEVEITQLYSNGTDISTIILKRDLVIDESTIDYQTSINNSENGSIRWAVLKFLRQHKIKKQSSGNYTKEGNVIIGQTKIIVNSTETNKEKFEFLYTDYTNRGYTIYLYNQEKANENGLVDWRELIYQMALDYYKNEGAKQKLDLYEEILNSGNNEEYYPQGITGYETFYIDLQAFWRQLYNPNALNQKQSGPEVLLPVPGAISNITYSTETGWNTMITEQPENLNFWFDFMSTDSELGKYSISTIGDRTKVVNDNKVSAIYYKETPAILFSFDNNDIGTLKEDNPGYTVMLVPSSYAEYFTISGQGKSAQSALAALLNQHAFTIDSTTITSVPIYHLQPNTRIFVKDDNTKINGEYIVSKITVPLAYNGTMSITATKAVENIY